MVVGKKKRKKTPKAKKKWLLLLVILAAALVILLVLGLTRQGETARTEISDTEELPVSLEILQEETAAEEPVTIDSQLPYMLEEGRLEINSIFQYTGLNPDCNWEDGSNTGALVLINRSEEYLETVDIEVAMTDGVLLHFVIEDVPAGKIIWAFDNSNTAFDASSAIADVKTSARFLTEGGLAFEQVTASAQGTEVTLTNNTAEDLMDLQMHCHNILDGTYFGGASYSYPVEAIAAGKTVTISAEDCFMGEAAVTLLEHADR